jgi:heavy metal sensor kinase
MRRLHRRDLRRLSRSLRFRLTASYVLLFAVLLTGIAGVFRAQLARELTTQAEDTLNEEWAAVKSSLLRIDTNPDRNGQYEANWYYDAEDPDEKTIVYDIQKVYTVADAKGNVIPEHSTQEPAMSTAYQDIGLEPKAVQARVRELLPPNKSKPIFVDKRNSTGELFKIRAGIQWDERHQAPFYVAIGTSLLKNEKIMSEYTWMIFLVCLGSLLFGSVLGWIIAGRVLTPVLGVAQAAQRISGSSLGLRIPTRESGDELDYLILTFNRMSERLAASFQQMKQFSADVSHELRTPITAIRGQLEVALFTAKTTDQYREAMFNALQDIDRLSQIVRALLLLSQAESGQLVLQRSRLDLGEVVRDLVEQFQIPAEAAGVHLTADLAPDCVVEADRVQIERMVTNLLSNAIKFTPEGGTVHLAVTPTPEHGELVVEDTGRGIPKEYLPHIFDRFYRVPGSGTAPGPEQGLGLGLSFVAWIVQAHRGTIEVDSTPGKGTRFTIKLPADGQEQPFSAETFSANMSTPC